MIGYMFDTNIFNAVLDQDIELGERKDAIYYNSHIPLDENQQTSNAARREQLERSFHAIGGESVPTTSAILDVSKWDQCSFDSGDGFLEKIRTELRALDRASGKRLSETNQSRDALVAHTCISNGFFLVTNDKNLRAVSENNGGKVLSMDEFLGT